MPKSDRDVAVRMMLELAESIVEELKGPLAFHNHLSYNIIR